MQDPSQSNAGFAQDHLIGGYRSLSRAHAADPVVRRHGSAGGVVTALLLSAMEQRLIDAALVVTNDDSDPTRPKLTVARTPGAIRAAAQSKYCIVPVNSLLAEVPDDVSRLGIVALPCQARGLQLARALDLAVTRRVSFIVGLFCGFNMSRAGTSYLLSKLKIRPEKVATLEHRGGDWPGGFRVVTHDGRDEFISKHQCTYAHLIYSPEGCWHCPDLTAEFADVSVGDYWVRDERARSMVIGRTVAGQALLDSAKRRGDVIAETISYEDVLGSHRHLLLYKKAGVQVRRSVSRRPPVKGYELPSLTAKDRLGSLLLLIFLRLGSSSVGRLIVGLLPLRAVGLVSTRARAVLRRDTRDRV